MLKPLVQRPPLIAPHRDGERGVTIVLVALAMVGIIAMASLSIDIGTLYQAGAEAQRSADDAALAAARTLSLSGMTGDPQNSSGLWQAACTSAIQMAQTVAGQNLVGGSAPTTVNVTFLSTDGSNCTTAGAFGVNPMVQVQVVQSSLPTFFSRIWGRTGSSVSATATAEVFNPSNSGSYSSTGAMVPVQPRCVKPLVVPNLDPGNCPGGVCQPFVRLTPGPAEGSIVNGGIQVSGAGTTGVIGELFYLFPDCNPGATCNPLASNPNPPQANVLAAPPPAPPPTLNLEYVPGQVLGTPEAVPSCANANSYQQAIAGCDTSTPYQCGVPAASSLSKLNLNENPGGAAGDTNVAVQCLIDPTGSGQDTLITTSYPYQIQAGKGNPLNVNGQVITNSNAIVSLPIYDQTQPLNGSAQPPVAIVGFLQVFIQTIDVNSGIMSVYVLNVAGCGGALSPNTPINGTSPVPVRLITPP
jgi:Flp pilus assembly protein TadG